MTIMNQLVGPGSSACSLRSKDPSIHSTTNQFPISVRFNRETLAQKQNSSSLTCRANDILQNGSSEVAQFQPVTLNFIETIYDHAKFWVQDHEKRNTIESLVLRVSVSSAVKLGETQIELIAKKMRLITGFPNVRLENTIDPSLIAGFVINYGTDESSVIDLSVKGQLAALANQVTAHDQKVHGRP